MVSKLSLLLLASVLATVAARSLTQDEVAAPGALVGTDAPVAASGTVNAVVSIQCTYYQYSQNYKNVANWAPGTTKTATAYCQSGKIRQCFCRFYNFNTDATAAAPDILLQQVDADFYSNSQPKTCYCTWVYKGEGAIPATATGSVRAVAACDNSY